MKQASRRAAKAKAKAKAKASPASKGSGKGNRITEPANMEIVSVEAYNALTGDQLTKANFPKLATTQELLRGLCRMCKMDPEETALIYNGNRVDLENTTLEQLGCGSEVNTQLLKSNRKITTIYEMIRVFNRHLPKNNDAAPVEPPPILSFLDPAFRQNYGGEFVARMLGDGEGCQRHTKEIRFYSPDGEKYCSAIVDTRGYRKAYWMLDSRPVFLHIRSVGTNYNSNGFDYNSTGSTHACAFPVFFYCLLICAISITGIATTEGRVIFKKRKKGRRRHRGLPRTLSLPLTILSYF